MQNKDNNTPFITFINAEGIKYHLYLKKMKNYKAGECDSPECKKPKIIIDSKLGNKRSMNVLIEEMIHSFFFEKTEREVRRLATIITKILYKMGYRKIK